MVLLENKNIVLQWKVRALSFLCGLKQLPGAFDLRSFRNFDILGFR